MHRYPETPSLVFALTRTEYGLGYDVVSTKVTVGNVYVWLPMSLHVAQEIGMGRVNRDVCVSGLVPQGLAWLNARGKTHDAIRHSPESHLVIFIYPMGVILVSQFRIDHEIRLALWPGPFSKFPVPMNSLTTTNVPAISGPNQLSGIRVTYRMSELV
jgi:hypothetical protein